MKKGYIFILITALAFSTMEIVGKMVSNELNPFQLTFIRFLIGGVILFPFALKEVKKRGLVLKLNDFAFFTLTGAIGVLISMSFFQLAVQNTKASIVAVIFSTNSVFTIPLAAMILKEKVSKKMLITFVVNIFGILLIFNPFSANPNMKGILLAVVAAVTFSLYGVISKKRIPRYGGLILSSFSFIIGDILLLACLLFFKIPVVSGIDSGNLPHLLYLGIFVTGIGYLSYFEAMKRTSAITASIVFFIKPGLAPILSLLILGESISVNAILGIICIIAGSSINFIHGKPGKPLTGSVAKES